MSFWNTSNYKIASSWTDFPLTDSPEGVRRWNDHAVAFFREQFYLFAVLSILYLPGVYFGRKYMASREGFELRRPLQLWNLALCVFSGVGAVMVLPPALLAFAQMSPSQIVCSSWCFGIRHAEWIFFFNVSKVFEFVDTVFIVLRKRPLMFLHYYHHVVTLGFCWFTNQIAASSGHPCAAYYFALMNYIVHFVMYGYYFVRALGYKPKIDTFITTIQIIQMIFGVVLLMIAVKCENGNQTWLIYGFLMYFSFFLLFIKFFYDRYIVSKKSK